MEDFYQRHHATYFEKTCHIDPSSFLLPLIRHLKPGATLLDVGCGSGRDLLWLKELGFDATGFERSRGLAGLARKHAGCEVMEGDFQTHDFSKQPFDAMLLCGSLVHIPHARFETVFINIVSGLRPGGSLMISLKEGRGSSTDTAGRRFYFWQDLDLRPIFSRQGFKVRDLSRSVSKVSEKDLWLSYVLNRGL